jgi:serine/threonine protein kinase
VLALELKQEFERREQEKKKSQKNPWQSVTVNNRIYRLYVDYESTTNPSFYSRFEIDEEYELLGVLGSGSFTLVCLATNTSNGKEVSIKKLEKICSKDIILSSQCVRVSTCFNSMLIQQPRDSIMDFVGPQVDCPNFNLVGDGGTGSHWSLVMAL